MSNTVFTGAGVAIVTPMNPDGSINFEQLASNIEHQIENSTDAIVVCGTTGEPCTMSDDEHIECIRFTVEKVGKRVPVIAGTGSNDTKYSAKLSKTAQDLGADALLIMTPYYNKTSQSGLVKHFGYIADAVQIPIILYNIPGRSGINIDIPTYGKLAAYKNITAVKEASGNISYAAKLFAQYGDRFDVYSGNDDIIVPIMSLGGKGVISVLSNILPQETHDMTQFCLDGDFKSAASLQLKYLELINSLFIEVSPIPVKYAMNLMELNAGTLRLPLTEISDENAAILKFSMERAGILNS
ncbi:MAG: 4-hydroxy-tetrahydrodipicolinate synthase [Oscillospiraceae bacterium]|jgi:4-hydroxy-tetrahydrodipicolinate synthase|nr:4-hydroxy-tetrahydrodipicolinate synthase [Oscillospiraceae bacterium]